MSNDGMLRDGLGDLGIVLDQLTALVGAVDVDALARRTPCADWSVRELVEHVIGTTEKFADGVAGRDTAELDPAPAERGLAFMRAHLADGMRGEHFGPEQAAPEGADAYQRIAAFAGRPVG